MDESDFKKKNKPASCTMQPWRQLVPVEEKENILRTIRQETIEEYGHAMDECPKRKVCIGKQCLGRPLPWKSETAKPYLEQLKLNHKVVNEELFISDCNSCALKTKCSSPCAQINDFISRNKNRQPAIDYKETVENFEADTEVVTPSVGLLNKDLDIPWDSISDTRQKVIKKYLYEQKDFLAIAKELDLNNQARVKYEFYAALTKLSEVAVMRKYLKDNQSDGFKSCAIGHRHGVLAEIYENNKSLTQVANECNLSKQAVQQMVARVIKKHKLSWNIYVRKQGTKVIYNVPELMR